MDQPVVLGSRYWMRARCMAFSWGAAGGTYRLHGPGVQAGVIHHRGERRGGGIEILDLLRHIAHVPDEFASSTASRNRGWEDMR